jgi:hypothetical protein
MYKCKYCSLSFKREETLISHSCDKKKRMLGENNKENRMAFYFWLKFHKFCSPHTKTQKTYVDFIGSNYYNGFMAFAEYVIRLNPISTEDFFDFVIRNSVKLSDWCKDWVYEAWVKEISKKESVDRAVERCVILMRDWAEDTGNDWVNFFTMVGTGSATQWIRTGKISPWIIYSTDQGQELVRRLNSEQLEIVIDYIDPKFWRFKIARNEKDAMWIQDVFNQSGIITHETI